MPRAKAETDADLALLPSPQDDGGAGKAIIVGYGRVGQLVGEMLTAHQIGFIVVETNAGLVRQFRDPGVEIYWGDATRSEFLGRCGADKARALVVTIGGRRPPKRSSRQHGSSAPT